MNSLLYLYPLSACLSSTIQREELPHEITKLETYKSYQIKPPYRIIKVNFVSTYCAIELQSGTTNTHAGAIATATSNALFSSGCCQWQELCQR